MTNTLVYSRFHCLCCLTKKLTIFIQPILWYIQGSIVFVVCLKSLPYLYDQYFGIFKVRAPDLLMYKLCTISLNSTSNTQVLLSVMFTDVDAPCLGIPLSTVIISYDSIVVSSKKSALVVDALCDPLRLK